MKKKILSILLIITLLIAYVPAFVPNVSAKEYIDASDDWVNKARKNWVGEIEELPEYDDEREPIVYQNVDEYLLAHYKDYENTNKSEITSLAILSFYNLYMIEDFSGLYEFPNLTSLYIETWEANIDFSKITNLKKLAIENLCIRKQHNLDKLVNLTYLDFIHISPDNINGTSFEINLSKLAKLTHFESIGYYSLDGIVIPPEGKSFFLDKKEDRTVIHLRDTESLSIEVNTNKNQYILGEEVVTTVSWDKGMQATDYVLYYDIDKVQFETTSLGEDFYNVKDGKIIVSWASFEEKDTKEMTFTFKAIEEGAAEFEMIPENFADGSLESPDAFEISAATKAIQITENYMKEETSITTDILDNKEILIGLPVTKNKVTIKDFLDEDNFASEIQVKIYNNKNEEITDVNKGLGTGWKIKLYKNGELFKELTVVVYGDTSGDGKITPSDALTLIKAVNKKIELAGQEYWEAGRVRSEKGKKPSAVDALAIIKHLNNKYEIQQGI